MRSPSQQLEKACVQQWRPNAAKNKKLNLFFFFLWYKQHSSPTSTQMDNLVLNDSGSSTYMCKVTLRSKLAGAQSEIEYIQVDFSHT